MRAIRDGNAKVGRKGGKGRKLFSVLLLLPLGHQTARMTTNHALRDRMAACVLNMVDDGLLNIRLAALFGIVQLRPTMVVQLLKDKILDGTVPIRLRLSPATANLTRFAYYLRRGGIALNFSFGLSIE